MNKESVEAHRERMKDPVYKAARKAVQKKNQQNIREALRKLRVEAGRKPDGKSI